MAHILNHILLLFTIALNIENSNSSSCSFNINATTQTPYKYDDETSTSPDCDDTAIIINEGNMTDSLIVGTLKKGGLELYALNGSKIQSIAAPSPPNNDDNNKPGRFNNVAAIDCLLCDDKSKKLVIVSDRGLDQLRFYMLNDGQLEDVTNDSIPYVFSKNQSEVNEQHTAYGLTATNYNNSMTVLVSQEHENIVGVVNITQMSDRFSYEVIDTIILPTEFNLTSDGGTKWTPCMDTEGEMPMVEGMVIDPYDGTLLMAMENVGLLRTSLDDTSDITLIDAVREFGVDYTLIMNDENETECLYNGTDSYDADTVDIMNLGRNIVADAEGISLYVENVTSGEGYYVLSCQGASFFNIYTRNTFKYIGNFSIYYNDDKVEETDGVEISSGSFGMNYPEGIIIVQDEGVMNNITVTNFKFASFEYILDAIDECDQYMNTTSFYPETTNNDNNNNGDGSMGDNTDHKTTITILGIVFGVIFVAAIGLCLYFYCFQNCGDNRAKVPDNYVELQNK